MKNTQIAKTIKSMLAYLMVLTFLLGSMAVPVANAAAPDYTASYIQKLDGVKVDYSQYLDNSVMFELPEGIGDDEEISVIVTLDRVDIMEAYENSNKTMSFTDYATVSDDASEIRRANATDKAQFLADLDELGVAYTTGEDYDTVLSGFELLIKAGDFKKTASNLSAGMDIIVGEVYEAQKTELVENEVNVFETGIFDSSDSGYDGTGMVVAVLDTGLDYNHTAFSTDNFTSETLGLTYEDVAKVVDETKASELLDGLTAQDVYISEKVPYGFDYADSDPDPYSTHNNHGTHVSGIIVGNDDTIRGVAPNAQLVSMKIFSDVVDTSRTAWILAALEDCVVLGVDVINMSIGTACGFSRETDEESVGGIYDKIRDAGINMIVAASNSYSSAYGSEANGNLGLTSNPDTGTVGSPSTYDGVMSVASISGTETPYLKYGDTIIYFTESSDASGEENDFFKTLLGEKDSVKIDYVRIPGVGRSADYTGVNVKGKIALVRRGQNTFEEKAMIAQEQGAAGIIIYNNVSGDIKMNVGEAELAACSISQNDGELLAKKDKGTLKISKKQTSGPFISDFSSWGPSPNLELKPEITAHGGSILSAITGGSYDRISGTSMACPNLAGVVVLLRQYVVENFPEIADDNQKINIMVNSLMMSTADIALGKNGLPYSVRKQGAGLANLTSSIKTPATITTTDADGNVMDKAKIQLGDDPERTGEYEFSFTVHNFGKKKVTYSLGAIVMTEGVSETKTNSGKTTITEESYILEGAKFEIVKVEGGKKSGKNVKVGAGKEATVTARITLTKENKKYLNDSFENGMYVEGFITLKAKSGTKIDLNVPYLAFYGDWTEAPMFDLTYYDTNADELDDGIDVEDKVMADAYASRPIGGVSEDYVSYLGSYYFLQDPEDIAISAQKEHVSLSNQEGTIHSLRYVWAGMLRNAAKINISITDSVTGDVIFEKEETDIRKSYSDGGAMIYPANVELEFDAIDYNLENNSEYTVRLEGYLDYGDGGVETNKNNVFEFPLVADFEAPTITNVEYTYKYDKTLEKNRLYADVYIYDNHYTMSSQLGYVTEGKDENDNVIPEMKAFEQYMTPVYSERNSTTKVTYELTDYIYDIKNYATKKNTFVITAYDYALNFATYEFGLPDNFTEFVFDGLDEGLTLSPNEVYTLTPSVTPGDQWAELIEFSSSKPSVVRVVNNKLVAVASGTATIKAQDPNTNESITFKVTVLKKDDEGYKRFDKPVADVFTLDGFNTIKAYYILENEDKDIGDTGSKNQFEGKYNLAMYPSESVLLQYSLDSYFPKDTKVAFESSNEEIVKVDASGCVTAVEEGFASVTVKVLMDNESTYYSETVSVEVKDPYVTTGPSLTHYYGNGGLVDIPKKLSLTEIGSFAFSNFNYVMKTEAELALDDREKSKQWFIGDSTITKVVIPEGVEKINSYAFANLTALEEVVFPSTLEHIDYGAFYNCTSLKKITFSSDNNLKVINQNCFENCNISELDLSAVCVISNYAFAGNQNLKKVVLGDTLISVGQYAFAGCKKLSDITIESEKVKYGAYAFTGCASLKEFYVNSSVLPEGMFYECKEMTKVTIGPDVDDIGVFAFRETQIKEFEIHKKNKTFKVQTADHILTTDSKTLVAVSPVIKGEFTAATIKADKINTIAKGAFSHNQSITSVTLEKVTKIGDYGLASNKNLKTVKLGELKEIGNYAFFEASISEMPAFTEKTKIGKYAFSFSKITSVTIPDGFKIEEGTFSECSALETVVIGDDVTIGDHAFSTDKDTAFKVLTGGGSTGDGEDAVVERKYFYYEFSSPLKNLTIGKDAKIGDYAFNNAASLETVTLGEGAEIGKMSFYNTSSLKNIDLSKVKSFGDYAISGDVYYACLDDSMTVPDVTSEGMYRYTYHGPLIESADISSAKSIGEYSFSYCRNLVDIKLGDKITEIPKYAFAGCAALKNINLTNVEKIDEYAFMECGLEKIDISKCESVGDYGFVSNRQLATVVLCEKGTDIGEGTFSYCDPLATVTNLNASENIGDYSFAYDAITEVDLTSAVTIGKNAFMKETLTNIKVTLGEDIEKMGDNPFAMCKVAPFTSVDTEKVNGVKQEVTVYDFELSDNVLVIDGSIYCKKGDGLELITFAGKETQDVNIHEDTIRISALAFAGSDVVRVKIPFMVTAIGHKAFYKCDKLEMVLFGSHNVPNFEEEFDPMYYETFEHIPGSGDYGTYTDYDGNEVPITGTGILPYYMWNATDGQYFTVFYGANFVDYVGYVENKPTIVKPINGTGYDSFICDQYFDLRIDGPAAPDRTSVEAIKAINAIPERVALEHKELVVKARAAFDKIATIEQQALVSNYSELISAEQRIKSLESEAKEAEPVEAKKSNNVVKIILIIVISFVALIVLLAAVVIVLVVLKKKRSSKKGDANSNESVK
ncbi:MAG: leucine-rich repeat protein [Clostridia bacterium]|nr:leucine-rich repeat protein [Clostridia bacterium]